MITTLDDIKSSWLHIQGDTTHDSAITALIGQASAIIKDICKQPIEQEAVSVEFDGDGYTTHNLKYTVPVSVTSLSYKTDVLATSWTSIANTEYTLLDSSLYYGGAYTEARYKAVLQVGYTTIPSDIIEACSELVVQLYNRTNLGGDGMVGVSQQTVTQGGVSTATVYSDLLPKLRERLIGYTAIWM